MFYSIRKILLIAGAFLTGVWPVFSQKPLPRRQKLPGVLREVSGMVRTPEGRLWLLNDSRNPPELYLYDPCARQLLEVRRLPVPNRDWEDLASAPNGALYIGDFGNNRNDRRDLCIFRYYPDTEALDSIRFTYPDQREFPPARYADWNFNCEAMVFWRDSLHLFSKAVFASECVVKHYVVPAQPGVYVAELRDSLRLTNRVITGAALSDDGRTLALTSYIGGKRLGIFPYAHATAFFFRDFPDGHFLRGRVLAQRLPQFPLARQYEAIAPWSERCWLVANERRAWQRQRLRLTHGPKH
ncbi:MAG: hypothetical protein RMJ33_11595 [Saprospiraceae bacterium]|nr:hypothetical protein [Saprospiraceae bacterium]MDW8230473.1 hypothetical protein [Saprospiraceae bacterium]